VRAAGPFDIRFNPSQFDDLERDIRSCLAGLPSLYAGHVAVRHMQHSSLAKAASPAGAGQIFGNKLKLERLYEADQTEVLARTHLAATQDHMAARFVELAGR